MRSILKSTAVIGSSAIVTIALGVITVKAWALMVGAPGLGLAGLLQTFLALLSMLGGVAGGAGVVRAISMRLASNDAAGVDHLRYAASVVTAALGVGLAMILIALRQPISELLGTAAHEIDIVAIAVALVFSVGGRVLLSVLNGYQRVRAMATVAIVSSMLSAAASIAVVFWLGEAGISVAVLLTAFIGWLVGFVLVRLEVGPRTRRTTPPQAIAAARSLLSFGSGYLAGQIPGTAVQFLVPLLVLHELGLDSAGFFRAAAVISVGYLGFLIRAIVLEYYPRLTAAAGDPGAISRLIRQQQWVVLALAVPLVTGAAASLPVVVPLLYTSEFGPTIELLRWQLVGEIPRLLGWTLAYGLIAQGWMRKYFIVELTAALVQLLVAVLAIRLVGLIGAGIAYAFTTATYYALVHLVVSRSLPMKLAPRVPMLVLAATIYLLVLALIDERQIGPVGVGGIVIALGTLAVSGFLIRREFGRGEAAAA